MVSLPGPGTIVLRRLTTTGTPGAAGKPGTLSTASHPIGRGIEEVGAIRDEIHGRVAELLRSEQLEL